MVIIERLPDLANVVRFPLEQRIAPSMELIFELQPDCREVERVAEVFWLELPPFDLQHQVDAQTARYIAEQVLPLTPSEQKPALDALLRTGWSAPWWRAGKRRARTSGRPRRRSGRCARWRRAASG